MSKMVKNTLVMKNEFEMIATKEENIFGSNLLWFGLASTLLTIAWVICAYMLQNSLKPLT